MNRAAGRRITDKKGFEMNTKWEVYEIIDDSSDEEVLVGVFDTQEEASEKAREYGSFESGNPCAYYREVTP